MANGVKLMDDIHDQFLVCKICYQLYDQPKTLICLHTFCTGCLEQHLDAEARRPYRYLLYARAVSCPICRRKTDVPAGGIRRLPDNYMVASLTEVINKRKPATAMCEICKQTEGVRPASRKAVQKCLECCKNLCKRCVQAHQNTRVTQSHNLFDVTAEKDFVCKHHPDEVVRFYCEPCEQCVCVLCTFHEHRTHEVSSLDEGTLKERRSLDTLITLCKERITHMRSQLRMINKCESDMKQVEEHIRDMAIESISSIRRKEREMLGTLYDAYGEETISFLKEKVPLKENLQGMESVCNVTSAVLKTQSLQLLLLKKDTEQKLQVLLQHKLQMPPENIGRQVKFVPGNLDFGTLDIDGELIEDIDQLADLSEMENGSSAACDAGSFIAMQETQDAMQQMMQLVHASSMNAHSENVCSDMCNASGEVTNLSASNNAHIAITGTSLMKRKTQTDSPVLNNMEQQTYLTNMHHDLAGNLRSQHGMADKRAKLVDQSTDTRCLIRFRNQETSTRGRMQRSSSTSTDVAVTLNKSTLTSSFACSPETISKLGIPELVATSDLYAHSGVDLMEAAKTANQSMDSKDTGITNKYTGSYAGISKRDTTVALTELLDVSCQTSISLVGEFVLPSAKKKKVPTATLR